MRGDWVEIRRSDITLQEKLGEGAFGEAYKGLVRMDGKVRECAVKRLKGKDSNLSICRPRKCAGLTSQKRGFLKASLSTDIRINTSRLF